MAHSKNSIRKTLGIMDTSSAVIKNNYYELKNGLESGSGKSFEDISVIPEPENSQIILRTGIILTF